MGQHPIFFDDNPVKIHLYNKLSEMVDRRSAMAPYPVERVEVPFDDGKTISCLLHLLPDRRKAPCVVYVPGMDDEDEFDAMARQMTVKGHMDKVKCPTLLVTGEFDPLCPLEDAIEVFGDLTTRKEMWVVENQFHPLWGIANLGKLDCHHYVIDWLKRALIDGQTNERRIAYVRDHGDGPFGDCEWEPPVGPGQAYF